MLCLNVKPIFENIPEKVQIHMEIYVCVYLYMSRDKYIHSICMYAYLKLLVVGT